MKKYLTAVFGIFIVLILSFIVLKGFSPSKNEDQQPNLHNPMPTEETSTNIANPASQKCIDNGGKLEIVTNKDGSQFGMCNFKDFSCEEWTYFNEKCSIEEDAQKIKEVLVNKGLNLTDMKVIITKHLGKYIAGSVVPISAPGGGGYVFAAKDEDDIKVLADGNGVIMCSAFKDYPDFPAYLVSQCVDESGNSVQR